MFDQAVLERSVTQLPPVMRRVKLASETPYRRIGTAIDGNPREHTVQADIFVVGGQEYLVPDESRFKGTELVESIVRLDQAQRILSRPPGSRQMRDMTLSTDVPDSVREVLAKAVEEYNPSTHSYAVTIIRPQP